MKKLFAFIILTLFVFSTIPVYSQETTNTDSAIVKEPASGQAIPNKLRENMQEKREEVRDNMQEKRERVRFAVESKIKDTPAFERNKLLRVSETNEEKITKAKEYLTKMVDAEITELTALKERVQSNQDITTEESADSVTRI